MTGFVAILLWIAFPLPLPVRIEVAPVQVTQPPGTPFVAAPGYPDRLVFIAPYGLIRYAEATEAWFGEAQAGPVVVPGTRNNCCSDGQRLVAAAFSPARSVRTFAWVAYTGRGRTVVARLRPIPNSSPSPPPFTVWDEEEPVLESPGDGNASLAFGPGGVLYAAVGRNLYMFTDETASPSLVASGFTDARLAPGSNILYLLDSARDFDVVYRISAEGVERLAASPRPGGCRVTGAVAGAGERFPELQTALLFAHDCSTELKIFDSGTFSKTTGVPKPVLSLGQSGRGDLYVSTEAGFFRVDNSGPSVVPGMVTNLFAPVDCDPGPIQPGSLATVIGRRFTETTAVVVNGQVATVVGRGPFTGDLQEIVIQVPSTTSAGTANIDVWQGPAYTSTTATVTTHSPRILLDTANERAQILRADLQWPGNCTRRFFGGRICPTFAPGETVIVYAIGLGPVENPPPDGVPAGYSPVSTAVTATVGDEPAEVLWAGLAPGYVGLYQLNMRVPATARAGVQNLRITAGKSTSAAAPLPIGTGQ